MSDTQAAIDRVLTDLVDHTAHVRGAVLGSSDGHPLAARLEEVAADAASVAAMGAATLALTTQLARAANDVAVTDTHVRGDGVQVWVLDVSRAATLTVFAADAADAAAITIATDRAIERLVAALRT